MRFVRHLLCAAAVLLTALVPVHADANSVAAGLDLFRTDPTTTSQDFSGAPIPADFFDPGSDPFIGIVRFGGQPLGAHSLCPADDLSTVDTIVRRLAPANLPIIPSSDTIPIEIVELSLVSVNPITVTYNGGQNPELWDVRVTLSPSQAQPPGSMTIHHTNPSGGTFDSTLPVIPLFTFERQSDNALRFLDLGQIPMAIQFQASNVPWAHTTPPSGSCTSNFCVNPGALTEELALLAAHGVISVCPDEPTAASAGTWGRVKTLYR